MLWRFAESLQRTYLVLVHAMCTPPPNGLLTPMSSFAIRCSVSAPSDVPIMTRRFSESGAWLRSIRAHAGRGRNAFKSKHNVGDCFCSSFLVSGTESDSNLLTAYVFANSLEANEHETNQFVCAQRGGGGCVVAVLLRGNPESLLDTHCSLALETTSHISHDALTSR